MTDLLTPKQERNLRETVRRIGPALADLQRQLADVGMYRSMHVLNAASKELGWEAADIITGKQRTTP
jgi:hypothetical protein